MQREIPLVAVAPARASALYRRFLRALDGKVDARAWDLLIGSEPFAPGEWTIGREANALADFIDGFTEDRVHLVGHSGAASVVLAFVESQPDRVESIVVSEPPWVGADPWSELDVAFRQDLQRVADLPDADLPAGFTQLFTVRPVEPESVLPLDEAGLAAVRAVAPEYLRASLNRDTFLTVATPVLVAYGSTSPRRMSLASELLAASFPVATLLQIEGACHFDLWTIGAETLAASWSLLVAPTHP